MESRYGGRAVTLRIRDDWGRWLGLANQRFHEQELRIIAITTDSGFCRNNTVFLNKRVMDL